MASVLSDLVLKVSAQDTASSTVNSMGAKIKTQLGDISKLAAGLALGNLGTNIGMDIAERLKSAAEQIDTFGTAVRGVQVVTGASAESASALVAVFEHFGLSGEEAASKMSRFERALSGTDTALDLSVSGGKRGQQILKELGVSYQDVATGAILPMDQVLMNLAERWQTLDATSRNAAARGLFGGLGGQGSEKLNLILDQGRVGLEGLISTLQKEGLILSQENVDDVTRFTFAHVALDDAFKGLAITLGAAFMPAITATAAVIAVLTQHVVSDLVPAIKGWPDFIGPATLAIVGLGIGLQILSFVIGPILAPFKALIGLIIGHGAASATSAAATATAAAAEATAGAAAAVAAVPTTALAVAQAEVGTSALVATGLVDQYGNAIMREGAVAATAAPEVAALGPATTAAAAGATGAIGAFLFFSGALLAVAAGAAAFMQIIEAPLELIREMKAEIANIPADQMNPFQKMVAGLVNAVPTELPDIGKALTPNIELPQSVKDDIAKVQAEIDASIKANTPTIPNEGGTSSEPSTTALEAQAKAKKAAADQQLKIAQDAAAQRKEEFDKGELTNQTATMTAKLAADEATNNAQLLGYKQQIEDIDAHSLDFALKRQQLDESDAATVAKMAEAKLQAQSEDLSYQEKLLLAQARATRAAGGTVDMGALRQQVLAIREQQIQNEPGLLIAQHNSTVADRASQLTSAQQTLQSNSTERQKLAIQEAMQPFTDAATNAKRIADSMQTQLDMDKLRFEIAQQAYQSELITAQQTARATDAAYQAAVAAAQAAGGGPNAQGGVGSAPYGPLPNGVAGGAGGAGSGATVTIVQQNTVTSPADEDRLAQKTADVTLQYLNAAAAQQSSTKPAYHGLPGAFPTSTP